MLTNTQIVEILDKESKNGELKINVTLKNATLATCTEPSETWIHHGHVHDKEGAVVVIDKWFAEHGRPTRGQRKVMIAGHVSDMTPEDLIKLSKDVADQIVDQIKDIPSVRNSVRDAIRQAADMMLKDPAFDALDLDLTSPKEAEALRVGSLETGIPKRLLQVMCHVIEQDPESCNCGHCIAHRIFPDATKDMTDPVMLLNMAAIKYIASNRGPQPGPCKLVDGHDDRNDSDNDEQGDEQSDKPTLYTLMKHVKGEQ